LPLRVQYGLLAPLRALHALIGLPDHLFEGRMRPTPLASEAGLETTDSLAATVQARQRRVQFAEAVRLLAFVPIV
jgi:hypothetical protein